MCWDSNSWDNPYNQHRGDVTTEPPGGGAFTPVVCIHTQATRSKGWCRDVIQDRQVVKGKAGRKAGRLAETGTNQVGNGVSVQVQVVERLAWMGRRSDKWLSASVRLELV